jgi:multidrug resistance protein, MATE family
LPFYLPPLDITTHIRENFKLAYPVMLTNLGHVAMGVTDNIMVGNLNALSLAAAGLALVVFNVLLLFGVGVSYAITPLVATASGSSKKENVIETVRHGLLINFINSLFLIAMVMTGKSLLYKINQPAEVVTLSLPFLEIIAFSLIPVLVFQTFKQFAEGLSFTRVAMVVMIGANAVNVFLNYALIYGHFGFPSMGLEGAGWATFFSRLFMAIAIVAYVYYNKLFLPYRTIFSFGNYSRSLFRKILHLGIPSGGQFIFEVAAFDFSLVMMGWLGTITQAAHQIAINLATVSYMTTAGIAAAATVRIGYFYGSGDPKNLRKAAYTSVVMAMCLMAVWAVLFVTGRSWLPGLYVNEETVIPIASSLLVIAGLFQLSDGAQVVCASALRGFQDVKIPSFFIFVAYWVIGLPLGYYLTYVLEIGPTGIWWGLFIGLTITALALFFRLRLLIQRFEIHAGERRVIATEPG